MTLNHAHKIVRFGDRCGMAPTDKYKKWKKEIQTMLLAQRKKIREFVLSSKGFNYLELEVEVYLDSIFTKTGSRRKKHLDIENISKNLTDLVFAELNSTNKIYDDSFIVSLQCKKIPCEKNSIFYRLKAY